MQNDKENQPIPPQPSSNHPGLHTATPPPPPPDAPLQIEPTDETPVPTVKPTKNPKSSMFKGFLSIVQLVGGAVILAFVINQLVFQSYQVFGQSMTPTLQEGDRLIISKLGKSWSRLFHNDYVPKRGEIIVFHNPRNPDIQLVKRVVGLPGEQVIVENGVLTVISATGEEINYDELFGLELSPTVGNVDVVVPEGEIFVVGDNRAPGGSLDSRNELGTIPTSQIVGDLVIRIFPLDEATLF